MQKVLMMCCRLKIDAYATKRGGISGLNERRRFRDCPEMDWGRLVGSLFGA
jgi:hypothetical protein